MQSLNQIHQILLASKGKPTLVLFSGESCPWCRKLEEILKDNQLEDFCQEKQIVFTKMTLLPKAEEAQLAAEAGRPSARECFSIESIPTLILFKNGTPIRQTQYLDEAQSQGSQAYIPWLTQP